MNAESKNSPCVSLVPCPAEPAITGERVFREACLWVVQELAGSLLCQALAEVSTDHGFFFPACFLVVNSGFTLLAGFWLSEKILKASKTCLSSLIIGNGVAVCIPSKRGFAQMLLDTHVYL